MYHKWSLAAQGKEGVAGSGVHTLNTLVLGIRHGVESTVLKLCTFRSNQIMLQSGVGLIN